MGENMSNVSEKVSITEAQKFYEEVYKSISKDEVNVNALKPNVQDEIKNDPIFRKQFEYNLLAEDFFSVAKKRDVNPEQMVSTLNTTPEFYNAVVGSYKSGNIKSAACLNNAQVYKMAGFVLKDKILDQMEKGQEYSSKENLLTAIFSNEKERIQDRFNEKHDIRLSEYSVESDELKSTKRNVLKP